jgi:hypothetical protein
MPEDPLRFEPQLITEKQRFMSTTLLIEGERETPFSV